MKPMSFFKKSALIGASLLMITGTVMAGHGPGDGTGNGGNGPGDGTGNGPGTGECTAMVNHVPDMVLLAKGGNGNGPGDGTGNGGNGPGDGTGNGPGTGDCLAKGNGNRNGGDGGAGNQTRDRIKDC